MPNNPAELTKATIEAEKHLLGAIMLGTVVLGDRLVADEVKAIVTDNDFLDYLSGGTRARIYKAIASVERPDVATIANYLASQNQLMRSDIDYLGELITNVPTSYNYMAYAKAVAGFSLRRRGVKGKPKKGGIELAH